MNFSMIYLHDLLNDLLYILRIIQYWVYIKRSKMQPHRVLRFEDLPSINALYDFRAVD
jgi:hypothetical protein